jgi:hypothetical protein
MDGGGEIEVATTEETDWLDCERERKSFRIKNVRIFFP